MRHKFFSLFYIVGISFALVLLFAPPLIVATVKKSLTNVLPGASVDIKSCSLWPLGSGTLSGLEIRRPGVYNILIPSIAARLKVPGLLIDIYLKEIVVSIRESNTRLADITRYVSLQPSGRQFLPVGNIQLSGIQLDVQTADAQLQATGSMILRPAANEFQRISLNIPVMEYAGVKIINGSVNAAVRKPGRCTIERLNAGRLIVRDISANIALDNNTIRFEDLSSYVLGGSIQGKGHIALTGSMPYEATISATGLNLSVLVADFDFKEKLELSGIADGSISIKGISNKFTRLAGDFNTLSPGGVLNIKDQSTIDMIAQRSGQARDLISRSFTDYRYNQAQARLYAQDNKLILDAAFEGQMGKRSIQVVLHDFTVQGGEK
jgi:hypothetical protein